MKKIKKEKSAGVKLVKRRRRPRTKKSKTKSKTKTVRRRKMSKAKNKTIVKGHTHKTIGCKCGALVEVTSVTETVKCPDCTLKEQIAKFGYPKGTLESKRTSENENKITRAVGWHFRKVYVDPDGTVFHRGVKQPELKGTLEPTVIVKPTRKKKLNKREKSERFGKVSVEIRQIKKDINKIIRSGKKWGVKKLEKELARKKKERKKYL